MNAFEQLRKNGALAGVKVLSLSHVIAGPMAASMLGDFGADVVHIEQPGKGDPAREMGDDKDGVYLWWKVAGRNKRSLTLDLKSDKGREIASRLAQWADVVITNMRPSALERLDLSWEALHKLNPKLVYLQITGYGRDGPRASDPGFGKAGEAQSGVVYVTGFPDGPPIHTGFSHADAVTGLMGAYGILLALYRRNTDPSFDGELIDLALYESLFRLIEWQVIGYDQMERVYERSGNRPPMAPAAVVNTYQSADGDWITVTSGTTASVSKIVRLLGLPASEYSTARQQSDAAKFLDASLRAWVRARNTDDALSELTGGDVVGSRIYNVKDMLNDEVFKWRRSIVSIVDDELGPVRMQGVIPQLKNHGGEIWRTGAELGADNDLILREWLGMTDDDIAALREEKVI
ncbi:CaiB/BaiF CoA transferase family protein [Paraburkholderia silviterrae]|uniref:CoA transferase n=1 Tax=Paraburkholderia silviterrae TaxID=2528715 RepID=A0A4R5M6S0_9BURK|nr:CoA transferase [Paraburkholderia silviterrae]TDG21745.1 CoA transferase [Paraburkholderia silviterrae]